MRKRNSFVFGIAIFAFVCFPGFFLLADENGNSKTEETLDCTITTKLEASVKLTEALSIPFLAGTGALTSGNNMQFKIASVLTPVSVNGLFETAWTPIAFFQLVAGGSLGTGWNIPLGKGLCLNERAGTHGSELTGAAFSGLVWSVKGGSVLQFDFAAIKPGDWNHIVFRTYHTLWYRALSSVGSTQSWLYEADAGENRNGWNYYGNYFLGYQMPLRLRMIGVLIEDDQYLYDTPGRKSWGDNLPRWTFGVMGDYSFSDRVSGILLVQARTMRNFTGGTGDYGFYQDRVSNTDNRYNLEFYRLVATVSMKLK